MKPLDKKRAWSWVYGRVTRQDKKVSTRAARRVARSSVRTAHVHTGMLKKAHQELRRELGETVRSQWVWAPGMRTLTGELVAEASGAVGLWLLTGLRAGEHLSHCSAAGVQPPDLFDEGTLGVAFMQLPPMTRFTLAAQWGTIHVEGDDKRAAMAEAFVQAWLQARPEEG